MHNLKILNICAATVINSCTVFKRRNIYLKRYNTILNKITIKMNCDYSVKIDKTTKPLSSITIKYFNFARANIHYLRQLFYWLWKSSEVNYNEKLLRKSNITNITKWIQPMENPGGGGGGENQMSQSQKKNAPKGD